MSENSRFETPGPVEENLRDAISPIEDVIEDARNGRMYILVDHEDRENEGDVCIPAQMCTPEVINFMATHARGLICLTLNSERIDALGLPLMATTNSSRHETAFTVSIEAREGVSTGISAHDRARTVAVAIDSSKTAADIATPGHIFPLRARDGGVLVRAGHTEAATDVARLAGLNPSGVICEIMNEDGSMARLEDLIGFARKHGLKIGTIRDLIAYRRQNDHLVEKREEERFASQWGDDWRAIAFYNTATKGETLALVKGHIDPETPTLVRMHALSLFDDVFARKGERSDLLQASMRMIAEEGSGVVVLINRPGADYVSSAIRRLAKKPPREDDMPPEEQRDYGVGAQILTELGVRDMVLLTNTSHSLVGLDGYGLSIVGERPIVLEEK